MLEFFNWRLTWHWLDLLLVLFVLALSIFLSWRTWNRSGKKKSILALEIFRFSIVSLILITLFNPEKVNEQEKQDPPEIICLLDVSDSMNTLDTKDSNGSIESRIKWARKTIDSEWKEKLEQNSTVTLKPFSSAEGTDATDLALALEESLEEGNNLKAILFLSDGDSNTGPSVLSLAGKCRAASVPVYSIQIGAPKPLPDLSLDDAFAPSFALQDEKITINYRVSNTFEKRQESTLRLFANDELVTQKPLLIPASEETVGSIAWMPPSEGNYELKVSVKEIPGESLPGNNQRMLSTRVENKIIKALIVDSFPRWEYRFLRNALDRDPGIDMKCVLFHPGISTGEGKGYLRGFPASKDDLSSFDVIFLGDVGLGENELSEEQCENLDVFLIIF